MATRKAYARLGDLAAGAVFRWPGPRTRWLVLVAWLDDDGAALLRREGEKEAWRMWVDVASTVQTR